MYLNKTLSAVLIQLCILSAIMWADEEKTNLPHTLSADSAVQKAVQTHIDILQSSISLEQAARNYADSWNSFLPSVSASGTMNNQQSFNSDTGNSGITGITVGMATSLRIDAGLKDKLEGLKASYESGKISYAETIRSVECTVRKSYYALLYSRETMNMSKTSVESYQRQYDQTKQKRDRGVVPELDLLSAKVNLETAKTDYDSAKSSYENSLIVFLNTIGMEYDDAVELTDSLDYAESVCTISTSVLDDCVEKSATVISLKNKIMSAQLSRNETYYSSFFPALTFGAGIYPALYTINHTANTNTNAPYWYCSLGLSLPVDCWIPGSQAHDTVATLDDSIKNLEIQLEDTKKNVKATAVELYRTVEQSQKGITSRKLNVELAKQSYEMTEEAYQKGTKDLLTLQSSLDTYHSAQLQLRSQQYNLICNVLNLENALGLSSDAFFTNTKAKGAQ